MSRRSALIVDRTKAGYRFVLAIGRILATLVLLAVISAAAYEQVDAWRDSEVLKQVGRSVDIGGRNLNISCIGEGGPTVIFVSGRTAPGYVWMPTQRGVATFSRACWYDRAGLGWSDRGPDPAWGDAASRDLHQLLRNAGIARRSFSWATRSEDTLSASITMLIRVK
jgi:pimeloyl-ACP methyl ester carboxylesterase